MALIAVCLSSFEKCLFKSLPVFKLVFISFYFKSSFYDLWRVGRYQIYDINIFFHSMGCLFFLLISVLSLSL